jgi:hypothetical protein
MVGLKPRGNLELQSPARHRAGKSNPPRVRQQNRTGAQGYGESEHTGSLPESGVEQRTLEEDERVR